jgi:hypothetical protein
MAFACPNHSNNANHNNGAQVTTLDDDTEGETGIIPPRKP